MEIRDAFNIFKKNMDRYSKVTISDEMLAKANEFARKVAEKKMNEIRSKDVGKYGQDHDILSSRYLCGILGEMAVFELLGYNFADVETAVGDTENYNHPDLECIGLNVGVKSADVKFKNVPVINNYNKDTQIIVMVDIEHRTAYVCGYLNAYELKKHLSIDLIRSEFLRKKNNKKGFYGFEYLKPIRNKDILEKYSELSRFVA